jgi:hypothetical protein
MKIVKFKGGLGNQLFQYALLRNLQIVHSCKNVKADFSYFDLLTKDEIRKPRILFLNILAEKATKSDIKKTLLFKRIGNPLSIIYKSILYAEKKLNKKYYFEESRKHTNLDFIINYSYFDGYWQSWKYVEQIEETLRKEITPNIKHSANTIKIINKISSENSIFIGIRRGDYLASRKSINHYGSFELDYFKKAIKFVQQKVKDPVFYIFSNDIEWVKRNLNLGINIVYRENEKQTSDFEELFIMGACKHAIIVNSTFYWWGAWLISNKSKIVIAPKNWFADKSPIDIVPNSWIKI